MRNVEYRVVCIKEKKRMCQIEYRGKTYFAHYDSHIGRVECYDGFSTYIFPDKPGGMIWQALKYKNLNETFNSQEFMQAFTTEMIHWRRFDERDKIFFNKLMLYWEE